MEPEESSLRQQQTQFTTCILCLRSQQGQLCVRNTLADTFAFIWRLCWHFWMKENNVWWLRPKTLAARWPLKWSWRAWAEMTREASTRGCSHKRILFASQKKHNFLAMTKRQWGQEGNKCKTTLDIVWHKHCGNILNLKFDSIWPNCWSTVLYSSSLDAFGGALTRTLQTQNYNLCNGSRKW